MGFYKIVKIRDFIQNVVHLVNPYRIPSYQSPIKDFLTTLLRHSLITLLILIDAKDVKRQVERSRLQKFYRENPSYRPPYIRHKKKKFFNQTIKTLFKQTIDIDRSKNPSKRP